MLTLKSVSRIAANGFHLGFTSLCQYEGQTYVAYRQAQSHNIFPPGHVVIQRSVDLETWETAATLRTGGDDRDPHLVATDDHLYCLWGTYVPHFDAWTGRMSLMGTDLWTYGAWAFDGTAWGPPYRLCRAGSWLWSCVEDRPVVAEPGLLTRAMGRTDETQKPASTWYGMSYDVGDGVVDRCHTLTIWRGSSPCLWERWSTALDASRSSSDWQPSEPALFWKDAETLGCLVRTEEATLYGEAPRPFVVWNWDSLDVPGKANVHAPAVLEVPGVGWIVAGREYVAGKRKTDKPAVCQTTLWRLRIGEQRAARLERLVSLPSSGDCSYPGLVWDNERQEVLVSWYSQHQREPVLGMPQAADLYLARLTSEEA